MRKKKAHPQQQLHSSTFSSSSTTTNKQNLTSILSSVMRSLIARVYTPQAAILAHLARLLRSTGRWSRPVYTRVFDQYFRHFPTYGKADFREHYAMVRTLVPAENLLEIHVKQGWGPLCEFLGEPVVPEGRQFPRTNDGQAPGMMIRELVSYRDEESFAEVFVYIFGGCCFV